MGFLTPFVLGIVAGGIAVWQWGMRKQQVVKPINNVRPEAIVVNEPNPPGVIVAAVEEVAATADTVATSGTLSAADDLTVIHGIGPVYAKRLNAAGIQSFAQLAELAAEQVSAIVIQGNTDRLIDTSDWVVQAQKLVEN